MVSLRFHSRKDSIAERVTRTSIPDFKAIAQTYAPIYEYPFIGISLLFLPTSHFVIVVTGLMLRSDTLGVTSIVRDLALHPLYYETLIHFFRSSAWSLESLRLTGSSSWGMA
ncbi:hypothetical protein [Paenibacillus polymyxa]|uniref:hypothetical protein n=1 Tax=Paenibacillus polymyxa TaxID=1406 RepID=UPI00137766D5|nr:hypothetical protein [Paenibacillus polymyxa]